MKSLNYFAGMFMFSCYISAAVNPTTPDSLAVFGGSLANDIFQQRSNEMPAFLEHNMRAKQSFIKLLEDAATLRGQVAQAIQAPNAQDFITQRFFEKAENVATSLTPMCRYPLMMKTFLNNIKTLEKSPSFVRLSDMFEYRWREHSVLEWVKIIATEHTDMNQLGTCLLRIIHGPGGEGNAGDFTMLHYDFEKDWTISEDGSKILIVDQHYQKNLQDAFDKIKNDIDEPDIKIGYLEFKINGKAIPSRGFMYTRDAASNPDLSNVPFALLHPTVKAVPYHFGIVTQAFESARYCEGGRLQKIKEIAYFSYLFSLTMPYVRGSASLNEWLTKALYKYHKLGNVLIDPISQMDELAQASLTFEQFFAHFEKVTDQSPLDV